MKCMPQERWSIEKSQCPLWGLSPRNGGSESRADGGNGSRQRRLGRPTSTEPKRHYGDDTSRDDHVLERYHAVLVRAQTLQQVAGLDVILQHKRNFPLLR